MTAPVIERPVAAPEPVVVSAPPERVVPSRPQRRGRLGAATSSALLALIGLGGLVGLWAIVAAFSPDLPTPIDAWNAFSDLLPVAFHDGGADDKGIAIQLWMSLLRVFQGFALAAVVGIPLGMWMGGSRRVWQAMNPVVQLLRPVSPLAWFPIGLVVLKDSPDASVFVILVTALWPIVINTAAGAASIPTDQRNVARVFRFGRAAYVRHVMVPHTMPSVITGLRLSMGTAWMVIVAVEMLSGGSGIGFFVWNSYNGGNLSWVIVAIVLIGLVGVVLDSGFVRIGRRFATEEATR